MYQLLIVPTHPSNEPAAQAELRHEAEILGGPGANRSRSAHVGITSTGNDRRRVISQLGKRFARPRPVSETIASAAAKNRRSQHFPARTSRLPGRQCPASTFSSTQKPRMSKRNRAPAARLGRPSAMSAGHVAAGVDDRGHVARAHARRADSTPRTDIPRRREHRRTAVIPEANPLDMACSRRRCIACIRSTAVEIRGFFERQQAISKSGARRSR